MPQTFWRQKPADGDTIEGNPGREPTFGMLGSRNRGGEPGSGPATPSVSGDLGPGVEGQVNMDNAGKGEVVVQLQPEQLEAVIERAQRLDPDAFDTLVDAYGQRLFGFLYRFTQAREEAEDLLQEVFLRVVRTLPDYTHEGRFEGWLFRIAANLARDRIRRVRRRPTIVSMSSGDDESNDPEHGPDWDHADERESSPEQPAIHREEVDRMHTALAQLPDAEREVIMLRHYSVLSFAEIAELMGTPLGTALARAHRGLAKLRKIMECSHDT